jgi:hypothetical protein
MAILIVKYPLLNPFLPSLYKRLRRQDLNFYKLIYPITLNNRRLSDFKLPFYCP